MGSVLESSCSLFPKRELQPELQELLYSGEGGETHWGEWLLMGVTHLEQESSLTGPKGSGFPTSSSKAGLDLSEEWVSSGQSPEPAGAGKCPVRPGREHKQPQGFPGPPSPDRTGEPLGCHKSFQAVAVTKEWKNPFNSRKAEPMTKLQPCAVPHHVSVGIPDRTGCRQRAHFPRQLCRH